MVEEAEGKAQAAKYESGCKALQKASFKCLARNPDDKDACHEHFQAYKACRKADRAARFEQMKKERMARSGWSS